VTRLGASRERASEIARLSGESLWRGFLGFYHSDNLTYAASIAYYSLLSLFPLTMLAVIGHEDEMRLSCQVRVNGDCSVETQPAMNWSGENFWQKPYPNK